MKLRLFIISAGIFTYANMSGQSLDINNNSANADSLAITGQVSVGSEKPSVQKNVRNLIKNGNTLFRENRFADAEVKYQKALELDPNNEFAQYNLAASLMKQGSSKDINTEGSPVAKAAKSFENLTRTAQSPNIIEKSWYNLGNIAFDNEQYAQSIELYKQALRINPDDNMARENLRMAQLKQQEQQNQQQNQQNQQQQQEQQQEQQQDKQEQQNKQQQEQNKQEQQSQQQQQQSSMSDANAEKILKAVENEEAQARRKYEAQKAKEQNSRRRNTDKPW